VRFRTGIIVAACGLILIAAAVVWSNAAVPQLVKFPLDTNQSLKYSGRFVTYLDAKTASPLATPTSAPLVVNRTVKAVAGSSDSSVITVLSHHETPPATTESRAA
jgi:hypothetical protein